MKNEARGQQREDIKMNIQSTKELKKIGWEGTPSELYFALSFLEERLPSAIVCKIYPPFESSSGNLQHC